MLSQILAKANLNLDFISFSRIQNRFRPEQVVRGRIIQQLQGRLFIFRAKGLSLIAEATVPLQVGDRVTVKVQRNRKRIELKLLEVNGKPVKEGQNIPLPNVHYARLPVPKEFLGRDGFLEIYDYKKEENDFTEDQGQALSFQLLLEIGDSDFVVLKAYRSKNSRNFKIFSTDPEFSKRMNSHLSLLADWLSKPEDESVFVQVMYRKYRDLFHSATELTSEKSLNVRV
ncbi:MAG: hypothetical protein GXO76_05095 [Calditrichaeota bacterium]|nr:hypothetical protein [Calditrichota bacterium]